jgi:TRAP-type C4-dicarboxylate transport system permease small subunit
VIPSPTPTPGLDLDTVTPGIWGFVLTIGVIIAVILLIIDMVRRIRRVNYRAQVREQLEKETGEKLNP